MADCPVSERAKGILLIFLLVLLTLAAFYPALPAHFLNWDDEENVVFARQIRSFEPDNFWWVFTDFTVGDFKPLAWASYSFDYNFWRLNPFGYHLGNLLLHAASAVLVFFLAMKFTGRLTERGDGILVPAFFAAVFFSLHPLRVESVAWISERKDVLCTFFYLAAVLAYLRHLGKGTAGSYLFSLLLAVLALLSKPMAVTIPLVLFLLDLFFTENPGRRIWGKVPFFLLAGGCGLAALYGQTRHEALLSLRTIGFGERVLTICRSLTFYLGKTFLPIRVAAAYPPSIPTLSGPGGAILAISSVGLISALAVVLFLKGRKGLLFCWLWFVIVVLPVSGIFPTGLVVVADRFTYLPSAAIAFAICWGLAEFFRSVRRSSIVIPGSIVTAVLLVLCYRQASVWDNSELLWRKSVERYPSSPVALAHLGQLLYQRGDDRGAVGALESALDHLRGEPALRGDIVFAARSNLAHALGRMGRVEEGAAIFEAILEERDGWVTHHSLAGLYRKLGRNGQAVQEYRRALKERPDFVPALCEMGLILAQSGKREEAIGVYLQALGYLPDSPRTRYNLALAFLDGAEWGKAVPILEGLAGEYPGNARVAEALTIAYRASGRVGEADEFQRVWRESGGESDDYLPHGKREQPGVLIPIR